MLRWYALGLFSSVVLVVGACGDGYEEADDGAGVDAGADTFVPATSTPAADVEPADAAAADVEPADAAAAAIDDTPIDATAVSFCAGRTATLCEDFESSSGLPSGWTALEPSNGGTLTVVGGDTSPRAMRMDPREGPIDAGLSPGGPSIYRTIKAPAAVPTSIDVSFRFRIGTIRSGGRLAKIDIGGGQGFHITATESTQGFWLQIILETGAGPVTSGSFLILGGWHTVQFSVTGLGNHVMTFDGVTKSSGVKFSVLDPEDMTLRFGSFSVTSSSPPANALASVEFDDILVTSKP